MKMKFLIRLNCEALKFEEVTELVFNKRQYAINEDGTQRYGLDYVMITGSGTIQRMELSNVLPKDIGWVCRAIGVTQIPVGSLGSDFITTPTHVKFKDARRAWLVDVTNGTEYTERKKAA